MVNKAFMYIIIGAALWGTIGWYVKNLYAFGFTPMEVVTLRAWSSAILLVVYLIIFSPKKLKLHTPTDIKYFLGTGILSITFFNYCLFTAIELSTIPIATALLYTAPAFVTIMSFFLFKEALTKIKIIALFHYVNRYLSSSWNYSSEPADHSGQQYIIWVRLRGRLRIV